MCRRAVLNEGGSNHKSPAITGPPPQDPGGVTMPLTEVSRRWVGLQSASC